jgi:hypothetical protein
MKKILLVLVVISGVVSCKVGTVRNNSNVVIVDEHSDNDGRPMFTVKLANGKVLKHMYAEEIAQGLLDGEWASDEDLTLTHSYSYEILLEQDSLHIIDKARVVAVVGYNQIGVLDSVFVKDNE